MAIADAAQARLCFIVKDVDAIAAEQTESVTIDQLVPPLLKGQRPLFVSLMPQEIDKFAIRAQPAKSRLGSFDHVNQKFVKDPAIRLVAIHEPLQANLGV